MRDVTTHGRFWVTPRRIGVAHTQSVFTTWYTLLTCLLAFPPARVLLSAVAHVLLSAVAHVLLSAVAHVLLSVVAHVLLSVAAPFLLSAVAPFLLGRRTGQAQCMSLPPLII